MEWISVKDRLPEKSDYYLCHVFVPYSGKAIRDINIIKYSTCDKCWICKGSDGIVTHWMQLPDLPKEIII